MLAKGSRNKTVISLGSVSSGCSADSAVPRSAVPQVSLTPDNVPSSVHSIWSRKTSCFARAVLLNSKVLLPD